MTRRRWGALMLAALVTATSACQSPRGLRSLDPPPLVKLADDHKSPALGVVLAIFPGIFVHGLGHYYAGDDDEFKELLEEEGYGVLFLGIGAVLAFFGLSGLEKGRDKDGAEGAFFTVTGGFSTVAAGLSGVIGLFLFFDSWIRDIVGTPAACRRANAPPGDDAIDELWEEEGDDEDLWLIEEEDK